jgi:hypothetical protein
VPAGAQPLAEVLLGVEVAPQRNHQVGLHLQCGVEACLHEKNIFCCPSTIRKRFLAPLQQQDFLLTKPVCLLYRHRLARLVCDAPYYALICTRVYVGSMKGLCTRPFAKPISYLTI